MHCEQHEFSLRTPGRGTTEITQHVQSVVGDSPVTTGTCHLFLAHTSASLLITENADPTVRQDLEAWLARSIPDGDALFKHTCEGPDDMPAHVRSALLSTSLTVPITNGQLHLGTWQGAFLFEHRIAPHQRHIAITLTGI